VKKGIIIGIIIAAGIFALISSYTNSEPESASLDNPIRITTNLFPGLDHAFIAQEKGFFDKYDVDVELILKPSYSENVVAFIDGESDGTFESLGDAVLQKSFGEDITVVYVMDLSTDGDVIVSNVQDISQLKGKTIGIVGLNSFSHIFVSSILESHGLDYFDVFYKNVDETNILEFLNSGEIHAGHTWEPTKTLVENEGYFTVASAGDIPGIITDVLVFDSEVVRNNPDKVQSIVYALNDARNFVYSNPAEATSIMAEVEGLSFEDMSGAINDAERPHSSDQVLLFDPSLDNSLKVIVETFEIFYKNTGIIDSGYSTDYYDLFDPTFVNSLSEN